MTFTFANEIHNVCPPEALQKQEALAAKELERLHALSDELQTALAELNSPETKAKFKDEHLKAERRRVREKFLGRAAEIESEIAKITERPLSEAAFWESPSRLLRGARLVARSEPLKPNGAFATNAERQMFAQLQRQQDALDTIAETSARNQLQQELLLSDPEDFLERVDDAVQRGDLATVFLAGLVSKSRDQKLRSAVTHRVLKVKIPEREQALESLEAIKEIASAAQSTVGFMRGSRQSDQLRSVRRIKAEQDEAAAALLEVAAQSR